MRRFLLIAVVSVLVAGHGRSAVAQKCDQPLAVPAGTSHDVMAKMIVDHMFAGIVLTGAQHVRAVAIVQTDIDVAFTFNVYAPSYRRKLAALNARRNEDLMALLAADADRAKLAACFRQMDGPARGGGL